jgi:hypothetical protein
MKKILSILVIGLTILFILSFIPSTTLDQEVSVGSDDGYLTLVPAAPPKMTPPTK